MLVNKWGDNTILNIKRVAVAETIYSIHLNNGKGEARPGLVICQVCMV